MHDIPEYNKKKPQVIIIKINSEGSHTFVFLNEEYLVKDVKQFTLSLNEKKK